MITPYPKPTMVAVPEHISSARRQGVTVGMLRQRNYCAWAVLAPTGQIIVGPQPEDDPNPGNKELASSLEKAIRQLGEQQEVYCLNHKLAEVLSHGQLNIKTIHTAPPIGARATIERALDKKSYQLCETISLYTDASKGSGLTIGTGWVLTYNKGPEPVFNSATHRIPVGSGGAELMAIRDGLNDIALLHKKQLAFGKINVLVKSDSQDALRLLDSIAAGSLPTNMGHNLLREAINDIRALCKQMVVRSEWVRGHNGDPGNETADRLAVNARRVAELQTPPEVARTLLNGIISEAKAENIAA